MVRITDLSCNVCVCVCLCVCLMYVWNEPFPSPKISIKTIDQTCQTCMYLYYLGLGLTVRDRDSQWIIKTRKKFISLKYKIQILFHKFLLAHLLTISKLRPWPSWSKMANHSLFSGRRLYQLFFKEGSTKQVATQYFCLYFIGLSLVTWPYPAPGVDGKCSLLFE